MNETLSDHRRYCALRLVSILGIAGFVILLDRLSKWWVMSRFQLGESRVLTHYFWLTYVQNTGTAFGMFQENNKALLIFSIVILGVLLYGARGLSERGGLWSALGVALVLGGAVGNMIDRIHYGRVIDFLDFRIWPVFNVADSAITLGACALMIGLRRK
ncbi:MAG: signal peptidase II [Elusimicrobiota bacterium]|jgi:signal peptidase II